MFPSGLFCFGSDRKFFFPGGRVKQFRFVSDQLMQGVGNGGAAAIAEHGNLIMGQLINSVIAVVLYMAVRPALKKAGYLLKVGK